MIAIKRAKSPSARSNARRQVLAGLGIALALLASALLILLATRSSLAATGFLATVIAAGALMILQRHLMAGTVTEAVESDWSVARAIANRSDAALAITDRNGRLVCTNAAHDALFGAMTPPQAVALDEDAARRLTLAGRMAWRDGEAHERAIPSLGSQFDVEVARIGVAGDHLIWSLAMIDHVDLITEAQRALEGDWGDRLAESGVMAALIGMEGRVRAANRVFVLRATGRAEAPIIGRDFISLLDTGEDGAVRLVQEGADSLPLRLLQIALDPDRPDDSPRLVVLLDEDSAREGLGADLPLQTLLGMLPLGLALADRDGRFLYYNRSFAEAAGITGGASPVYPGDLVIREDKAAVADAVRRFASGRGSTGDLAVRLTFRPDEPVALTIAGARGLGEAAVLLSLKDNREESRLKREVAQATKMQAVGQLAGGVAHDFNNILTAIIGHCDLMLLRHTPGDSDFDDIQQIRQNSNRAAALTRQLLAFSRQQTLRPQVLQLPDVISEVTNLLQRLMGDTVTLVVKHGRALGAVRADPGQLEQVIVNLAVNARDAMVGGGTLTLQTFAVPAADVPKLGKGDIMPVTDYTAISATDTGSGIPVDIMGKIFEPFFTTKEMGKGTGLGLSTVYGIVKQSGGFIFAESVPGKGTCFTLYFPVHQAPEEAPGEPQRAVEKPAELWGSGTILLVEDEDMVRAVAERALTRHGYSVITACNGEEAVEKLESGERFDLLISDVVMPTMDGPTLGRHARELLPELPILFMSGYAEEQLRRSIDVGNVLFLPKPFSVKQLAEATRAALAQRG